MATGKKSGNKLYQGDFRTPEGVYQITNFLPNENLLKRYGENGKIYGVGAFVLNYPNPIDRRLGKTGGGIWIHSTNDETRIEKGQDSRGCIVIANDDLKELSKIIELNKTSIVVVHEIKYSEIDNWKKNKNILTNFISSWAGDWQNENLDQYLNYYDSKDFYDHYRGNFIEFKNYKRAVFSGQGSPKIEISNLSLFQYQKYAIATFKQSYTSSTIEDIGTKILYLKQNEFYKWKIISEVWSKLPRQQQESVAFRPSMRFFSKENSEIGEVVTQ